MKYYNIYHTEFKGGFKADTARLAPASSDLKETELRNQKQR